MANDYSEILPRLLSMALPTLREKAVMPRLVNRTYETIAGSRGSTIDIPVAASLGDALDVDATVSTLTSNSIKPTTVPITLNNWKFQQFSLTDKEKKEVMAGVFPMQAAEAMKSLANAVSKNLQNLGRSFYGAVGTPGTTPFASNPDVAVDARRLLVEQLAPTTDLVGVLNPDAVANGLKLEAFRDASRFGRDDVIRDGRLDRSYGFDWYEDQNVTSFTAGTATGITAPSLNVINSETVALKVASGTGTLVYGDILTFAGNDQQYVVQTNVTLTTTAVAVSIYPPLKAAVDGATTPVVVTKAASHVMNLAFHPQAIALASRPLNNVVEDGTGVPQQVMVDPVTKLVVRLQLIRQPWQTLYVFDILWGSAVIRPELGVRIYG